MQNTGLDPKTGLPSTGTAANFVNTNASGPISQAGTFPVNTTVDASKVPAANPLTLPTTPPTTNPATPIIASAQATEEAAQKQAEADVAASQSGVTSAQNQKQSTLDYIKGLFGKESDAETARATGSDQQNIDAQNNDLAGINTEIANTNVKLRGALDEISGRGDISKFAQQGLADNAKAQYGRTLADLAIRQSAANGNIEALTKAADEKLNLILAPLQNEVSYYKDFVLQNEDQLTKSEQDKANAIIAEKNQIIAKKTADEKAKTDLLTTAMQNGVKISDADVAKFQTMNSSDGIAYLASKGYSLANPLDTQLKRAQIAKIYSDMSTTDIGSVQGWVSAIKGGTAKMTDVPKNLKTAVVNGLSLGSSTQDNMLQTTKQSLKELQDMVDNDKGFEGAVGAKGLSSFFGLKGSPVAGSNAANFDAKLKQTVNDVVLPNLTILHGLGRVTDREFQALQSSLTSLSTNLSEDAFKTELKNVTDQFNKINGGGQGGTLVSADGTQQVNISDLTPAQIKEAQDAGWK